MAPSSRVRSTQVSTTVRARAAVRSANVESWSLVKQSTSHRPSAGMLGHSGSSSTSVTWLGTPSTRVEKLGDLFSKTTTS